MKFRLWYSCFSQDAFNSLKIWLFRRFCVQTQIQNFTTWRCKGLNLVECSVSWIERNSCFYKRFKTKPFKINNTWLSFDADFLKDPHVDMLILKNKKTPPPFPPFFLPSPPPPPPGGQAPKMVLQQFRNQTGLIFIQGLSHVQNKGSCSFWSPLTKCLQLRFLVQV